MTTFIDFNEAFFWSYGQFVTTFIPLRSSDHPMDARLTKCLCDNLYCLQTSKALHQEGFLLSDA